VKLELSEWQHRSGLELSGEHVAALARFEGAQIAPDASAPGRWRVSAQHHVGVFRRGDLEVRITPKVPVSRLLHLLALTMDRIVWDDRDTTWGDDNELVATVAHAFAVASERVVHRGLLQGYRTFDDTLLGIRGRIHMGRQVTRQSGLPIPIEVTFDDFTTDIVENQLLAGATTLLLRLGGLPATTRQRLRRLHFRLIDITPEPASARPPTVRWTRLNHHYRHAVTLARLVLRSCTLEEKSARSVVGSSFLVDMNQVFEDIVGHGIRGALQGSGSRVSLQHSDRLDADGQLGMRADIVVLDGERPVAVADVKYKRPDLDRTDVSDVHQAVTYAIRYGLDHAHLIYATAPLISRLEVGGVTLWLHSLDLDATPEQREARLSELAERLVTTS
jgi:5-methylcytosine-specific restriction enzyme subunit McrC